MSAVAAMQTMKHGRLSRGIPITKGQAFSCGIFGVCSPFLLSPRTPAFRVPNNSQDFSASDILLIQAPSGDEGFDASQTVTIGTDTPNVYSLNIITRATAQPKAPISPRPISCRGEEVTDTDFTRRSPTWETSGESIEDLLIRVRKRSCSRIGLESLLRLVGESKCGNVRVLEEQVASALISLLISGQSDECFKHTEPYEEAFATVVRLVHNKAVLEWSAKPEMLKVLDWILNRGNLDARVNAAILLEKICSNEGLENAVTHQQSLLDGVVRLMLKREQPNAVKLASRALLALCLSAKNRSGAVRAGSVAAIVTILPSATITTAEKALAILELLATSSEGRQAMCEHELLVPVLVNIILKVSENATEYAAGALCKICTSDTPQIQERVVQAGARTRLLLVLQSTCSSRAKRNAQQLLKVLHRFWDQERSLGECGQTGRIRY